ncbi:MAG TPA: DoxX family protein [Gemmataceae bacterium]|jgi:hypothetical protein|nr:DoxX family protein [Gemmataceae bacterium]
MSTATPIASEVRSASGSSKAAIWTGRVISGLITLLMLMDGVMKLIKPAAVVEGSARVGIPESTITGIGIALLASTILYAVPATTGLGAILLTGYLGGAVMTHVRVEDPAWMILSPVVFGVLVWLGVFLRDSRLRQLVPIRR